MKKYLKIKLLAKLRPIVIGTLCLILTYTWPISQPWAMVTFPLRHETVDWTEVPMISGYGKWIDTNLSESAVILTPETRQWLVPRPIIFPESTLLVDFYLSETELLNKLRILAEIGVTHLIAFSENGRIKPFNTFFLTTSFESISWRFWEEATGEDYFKEVFRSPPVPYTVDPVGYMVYGARVFEIDYPEDLKDVLASNLYRPWLHKYALSGHSR